MINIRDLILNQGLVKSILGVDGAAADDPNWKNLMPYQLVSGFFFDSEFDAYTNGNVYPAAFVLENGKTYRVKWDGEQRECVAYSFTSGYSFVAIGNGKNIGYPDTGEKFLILYNSTLNTSHLFSEDDVESHYVGIWQKVVPQLLLQEKTITENGEYTADAGFDALGKVLVEVAGSGGSAKFATGKVYGTSAQMSIEHNLGVIPDIFVVMNDGSAVLVNGGINMYLGISSALASLTNYLSKYGAGVSYNGGWMSNKQTTPIESTENAILCSATEKNILAGISNYNLKTDYQYTWIAIGGLT